MQQYKPVKAEFINPFVTSTVSVFRTMLSCDLDRGELHLKDGRQPNHEISGVIGLSGRAIGTVVVSLSREMAIAATEAMAGERPTTIDADVVDVVGELANMVAGQAKAQLEELEMSISLPTVISGKNHSIEFPTGVTPIGVPFSSGWGDICVDVGLAEKA